MAKPTDILQTILAKKAEEIVTRAEQENIRQLSKRAAQADAPRGFIQALQTSITANKPAVIAEIKKASPSKGLIRADFAPVSIAQAYAAAGASCLSILTDESFFQGANAYLTAARNACTLPVLRKDFIIDAYQVYEARAIGADAILLIVAALSDTMLLELSGLAKHLDMDVLVEVHDEHEMARALTLGCELIGINNRNLRTFEVDLQTTITLQKMVDQTVTILITESGIHTRDDVLYLQKQGIQGFLLGETLMRSDDPGVKLRELFFRPDQDALLL